MYCRVIKCGMFFWGTSTEQRYTGQFRGHRLYRVTHKGLERKDDLKLLKYDDSTVTFSLPSCSSSLKSYLL